ncbi:ABC transporter permease [Staphylococcus canis]|uniref:ABC transporter permease n=1 Tax=Staphylococcus canis TaxID=2724942 RepID=A0ABS0T7W3_9STAP|nr:ABC transporter permease [Staphylococcus canis]MBI5974821.1 ABC transporter permease [Staphylococcus canis]
MRIKFNHVKTIIKKDLLEMKKDTGTLAPLLVIPFIFSVVLPLLIILGGSSNAMLNFIGGVRLFTEKVPSSILPAGLDSNDKIVYAILMYFFVPFFLLIPVIISTVLAASSLTGEKERKTLEGLLYTPINNKELMLGKILAAMLPAVIITWIALIVYGIILNSYSFKSFDQLIFPNTNWIIIGVLLAPLITFLSITLVLFISHKVKTSKSAQSVSMLLMLPIIGALISQASGAILFGYKLSLILFICLLIIDLIAYVLVSKQFNKEKFLTNM